ncbi:4394_t:CDS:2 [Diversispora eburnea]|uniref:4394_t:CDS:1 n=1 Tax=Diversispora eburnea TaxID=1213867 RepID=A0A9N8ZZH9_9GLOM|nr:4394_t:CDS:2 [Diversispora eburnea]
MNMASAHLSPFTSNMFNIPSIPKNPSNPVFPLSSLYSTTNNQTKTMEARKESEFVDNILEKGSTSNTHPRVVFSSSFSPQSAISPSDFSSSPASYRKSSNTTNPIHLSPSSFSVTSSVVSSPSSRSQSPRRSSRKPKPSKRSKEQILGKRRLSGPATRLRKHKSIISEDEEKECYYRERAAPIPEKLDAPYTKTRRLTMTNIYGVVGCGGYNFNPSKNPNYPFPPSRTSIISKWTPVQHKVFLASYLEHGKKFSSIGKQVHKTTAEVVEFYYLIKHTSQFRMAKAMKKEYELYEEDLNKIDLQVKGLAKLANGKKGGGRKKKAAQEDR